MRPLLVVPLVFVAAAGAALAQNPPFAEKAFPLIWPDSWAVAIGDFNEDGLPDVASLSSYGPFTFECPGPPGPTHCGPQMSLCVAPGQGFGRLGAAACVQAQCLPWALVTGDFNGDGRLDAVVGNRGVEDLGVCSPPSVSFFPGDGGGGFGAPIHAETPGEPLGLAAGDLDGDGRPEFVAALGTSGRVQVYGVTADGALVPGAGLLLGTAVESVALGDLDGDGHLDAAVSLPADNQVAVLPGDGLGGLAEEERCPTGGDNPQGVAIADFKPGGALEIAVANEYQPTYSSTTIGLLNRDATGSFCGPGSLWIEHVPGRAKHLAAADFNEDGSADLVATISSFSVLVLLNDGLGHVQYEGQVSTTSLAYPIAAGDLDQIGGPEIVTSGYQWAVGAALVSVLVNTSPIADRLMLDLGADHVFWIGVRDAVSYDVVRGDAHVLNATAGDFTSAVDACIADDYLDDLDQFPAEVLLVPDVPPPGGLWWLLARPNTLDGPGSYDSGAGQVGSRDAEIADSPLACP